MRSQSSPSGLWNRQSSQTPDESTGGSVGNASDDLELEASNNVSVSPLLLPSGGDRDPTDGSISSSNEKFFLYGHMTLSLLFLLAGSSIVPLFAAAEDESWRKRNIPYQKTAAGDVILDLRLNQPLVDPPTISSDFLIVTALVLPLMFVISINVFNFRAFKLSSLNRSQWHELRAGVCALLISVGLSESVTCTLKLYVSRPRPNFYNLCAFNPTTLQCEAPLSKVHEASLSFPSGHSSLSFSGMTFLVYFLLGRLSLLTASSSVTLVGGRTIQLLPYKSVLGVFCVLVPWSYCFFVASSRIVDHWHHPDDVVAGTLLGIAAATVGYHAFYPASAFGVAADAKAGVPLSLQQIMT